MECAPTDNAAVVHVAVAATSALAPQPAMVTPASWKLTVPVGTGPIPLTTAVKVTDCPNTDGFTEDVTVVVDTAAATSTIPSSTITMFRANATTSGRIDGLNRKAGSGLYQVSSLDW